MSLISNPEATEQSAYDGNPLPKALTITNPGAESGTTGWDSNFNGLPLADNSVTPPTGSFYFAASANQESVRWGQTIDVTEDMFTLVDANMTQVTIGAQRGGFSDADSAQMNVVFFDVSSIYIGEQFGPMTDPPGTGVFILEEQVYEVPPGTRKIRIEVRGDRASGTELSAYIDDFTLTVSVKPSLERGYLSIYAKQDAIAADWDFVSGTDGLTNYSSGAGGNVPGGYVALVGPDSGSLNVSHLDNAIVGAEAIAQVARGNVTLHVTGLLCNINDDDQIRVFAGGLDGLGAASGIVLETTTSPADYNRRGAPFHLSGLLAKDVATVRIGVDLARADGTVLDACLCGLNVYLTWVETTDPDFSSVSLLLGFEGELDNATTVVDESDVGKVVTFTGVGVAVDAAQSKFRTRSIDIVSDAYLSIPHATDVSMANANDMTFEAHVRCTDVTQINGIFNKRDGSSAEEFYLILNNTDFQARSFRTGSADVVLNGGITAVDNQWYHVAITREGSTWRLFIDGALRATDTQIGQPTANNAALHIGNSAFNTGRWFRGNIDEIRITAGLARYTEAFIAPVSPYSRS